MRISRQSLIPFNKFHAEVKVKPEKDKDGLLTGEMSEDAQLLFSQNLQILRFILSEDGHLVPGRTTEELEKLSTDQYTGRFNYNTDTNNAVVNIGGSYENIMTSPLRQIIKLSIENDQLIIRANNKKYRLILIEEKEDGVNG